MNQIVVVEITCQPTPYDDATGEVVEVIGDEDSSDIELEIAIRKHNLPYVFAGDAERSSGYGDKVTAADRKDVSICARWRWSPSMARRPRTLTTPSTPRSPTRLPARSCDCRCVALRRFNMALRRRCARAHHQRLLPRRDPMLPEALSNELCSLRPNVDRLCMVCDMKVSAAGHITGFEFYAAVMNSKARLTYTEVAAQLPTLKRRSRSRQH